MTFLLSCTIRASIILAAGFLITSFLRSRSAALRHFVLTISILASAAVPALMLLMPVTPVVVWTHREHVERTPLSMEEWQLPPGPLTSIVSDHPQDTVRSEHARVPTQAAAEAVPAPQPQLTPIVQGAEPEPARSLDNSSSEPARRFAAPDLISLLMVIWSAGVFIGMTSLLGGVLHLRRFIDPHLRLNPESRWAQIAAEVADRYRLRRRIDLFECRTDSILATWGVARPKLLLPAGAQEWPEARIRAVVHHELAHIQRGDWLIQLIAELHRVIYWFNPLYWMLCGRLVRESEQACDDVAVSQGIGGSEYAEHLLELTRILKSPRRIWSAALSMARESTLERRFAAILNPKTDRSAVRGFVVLTTLALFAGVALPLTSFRAAASAPASLVAARTEVVVQPLPTLSAIVETSSVAAAAVALSPQIPQSQTQLGRPAAIRGVVMSLGTNEPVSSASVELRKIQCGEGGMPAEVYTALTNLPNPYWTQGAGPLTAPQVLKTTTGGDGRFAFENLMAGSYCIVAFRGGGYLSAEYLQRSYRGPGSTITLAEGQQVSNINLSLIPTGSISGRVTDPRGEPLAHALILALEPVMYEGGRRLNVAMSTVQTNDLGEYRLYWLAPGRYYVAAVPEDADRRTIRCCTFPSGRLGREELLTYPVMKYRELEDGSLLEETYTYVYYGSGTDPAKALPVEVKPGLNTAGVDIPLTAGKQRSWHVRGTVINGATGQPAGNVSLRLMPREWIPNPIVPSTSSDASGAFDISGVIPGSYFLYATGRNTGERAAVARPGAGDPIPVPEMITRIPVTIGNANLSDVRVVISASFNLTGRVTIEGLPADESAPSLSQIRVRPLRDPDIFGQPAPLVRDPVPSGADGSFTLTGIGPGDYRVFVEPLIIPPRIVPPPPPPGPLQSMYVKAVRLGNSDVLSQGLHINGPLEGQLEVVIGKAGDVSGRVIDGRQQPVVNVTVAAIPEASLRGRPDLYKKTRTDGSGRFRLFGLAPGDYKLFAWEQVEEGIWLDADFLRPFENRGKPVRVNEGRTENVEVTVIAR